MNLHNTNWSKSNDCQIFLYSSLHAFPIHTNGFRWKTWLSDGIGKILLVTPSYGSKITGSHDGKEYRKSDKYWGGQKCCPMDSIDIHSSDGIQWSPSMSIGITRSVVVNLNSDNELTFRPLLIFSLSPTELGKILLNWQILSCKKNSIGYSSDFIVPLITKFTQTWPFFNCGYENLRRFDMQISRRWHGQRSLGRAYILFLYPYLKMLISVYIIERFSAVT